jgi:hypothetical protein
MEIIPLQESYSFQTLTGFHFPKLIQVPPDIGRKIMKLLTVLMLCAVAIGCGYGSHATMPATAGTTPVITALNPSSANHTDPGVNLMVNGMSFNSGAFVTFNGAKMQTTWTNSTLVTAMIPQTAIATPGTVNVIVTNPAVSGGLYGGGTNAAQSQPAQFTIN